MMMSHEAPGVSNHRQSESLLKQLVHTSIKEYQSSEYTVPLWRRATVTNMFHEQWFDNTEIISMSRNHYGLMYKNIHPDVCEVFTDRYVSSINGMMSHDFIQMVTNPTSIWMYLVTFHKSQCYEKFYCVNGPSLYCNGNVLGIPFKHVNWQLDCVKTMNWW